MFIIGPTLYTDASLIEGFESGVLVRKIMTGAFPMVQCSAAQRSAAQRSAAQPSQAQRSAV